MRGTLEAAARPTADTLLEVEDLSVRFASPRGTTHAVRGVSFTVARERLGIVGESGSGKSTTGRAVLGLVPPPGIVEARRLVFEGTDLMGLDARGWRAMRGARIAMVMQDPKFSLNPVMRVGDQIAEAYRLHRKATGAELRRRALDALAAVQIRDPELVLGLYPHQLSGGMGQRVMIAMMLMGEPDLLVADEATSALDVTVQNSVLSILDDLVRTRGMGLILITHNLALVSSFCDRVLVMYAGRLVETLERGRFHEARHPYTRALLDAAPTLDTARGRLSVVARDPAWLA